MLKKKALNRIFVTTLVFFIVLVVFSIKKIGEDKAVIYENDNFKTDCSVTLYTLNSNDYLSKTSIYVNKELDMLKKLEVALQAMVKDNNKNALLPSNFNPILPNNTKVLNISLDDNIIKINFSKELLNVEKGQEEKLIEAIVYTLTSNNINGVEIYVENALLKFIPNTSIKLPTVLTKELGINKVYDISDSSNINKVFLLYTDSYNNFIPVTKYTNDNREKIEIVVESLSNRYLFLDNLISTLSPNLKLLNYSITNNTISLNFNDALLVNHEINEDYIDILSFCIFNNYDVSLAVFYVNDEKILEKSYKSIE